MSAALKCPNPSCPFLFDPTQVPPGAMLTCPRCGMRFTLGPTPGGYAPPPPPNYGQPPQPQYGAPPGYPGQPPAYQNPAAPPGYPQPGYPGAPAGYPGYAQQPPPNYGQPPQPNYGQPPQPNYGQPPPAPAPAFAGGPAASPQETQLAFDGGATTAEATRPGSRRDEMTEERKEAIRERANKQGSGVLSVLIAVGGVLLIGGVMAAVMIAKRTGSITKGGNTNEIRNEDMNFAFRKPPEGWEVDEETKKYTNVNVVAYHRAGPEGWVAVAARDFGDRTPRPNELKERMYEILGKGFENLPAEIEAKPGKFNSHEGLVASFRGTSRTTGEVCQGDCYMFEHKGIGYWFFGWSTERDLNSVGKEIADIRAGFKVGSGRAGWTPKGSASKPYRNKAQTFVVTDHEGIWSYPKDRDNDPDYSKKEDDKCEMLLNGVPRSRGKRDKPETALLAVMVVESAGEPKDVAHDYITQRYKKLHADATVALVERTSDPEGDPAVEPADGGTPVHRATLDISLGNGAKIRKLVAYSAIASDGKVVIAEASCQFKDREVWEFRLMQIVSTLKDK